MCLANESSANRSASGNFWERKPPLRLATAYQLSDTNFFCFGFRGRHYKPACCLPKGRQGVRISIIIVTKEYFTATGYVFRAYEAMGLLRVFSQSLKSFLVEFLCIYQLISRRLEKSTMQEWSCKPPTQLQKISAQPIRT